MWKVTWNELFFYNSMDCLYSEIMIFSKMLITTTFSYSKMLIINVCLMILAEKYKVLFWRLLNVGRMPEVSRSATICFSQSHC